MQWRGGNCLRFAKQKGRRGAERPSRNKKAAAEQKSRRSGRSSGGFYFRQICAARRSARFVLFFLFFRLERGGYLFQPFHNFYVLRAGAFALAAAQAV